MRHILTIAVCLLLIAGMFAFAQRMAVCQANWKNANVNLSANAIIAIQISNLIWDYWFVPVAILVTVIALSIAALCQRKDES